MFEKGDNMIIENGRPQDERIEKETRCYDFLGKLNIEYDRVDHSPADDMETCLEIEKVLGAPICKNLFLCNRQQTQFYLLMMPGDKPFKTKDLSAQIGSSRLSFASAEHMEKLLDITPGSVSVLGLMNDKENIVKLLIDEDVLTKEYFGCHPAVNTSSLKIRVDDLKTKVIPALQNYWQMVKL